MKCSGPCVRVYLQSHHLQDWVVAQAGTAFARWVFLFFLLSVITPNKALYEASIFSFEFPDKNPRLVQLGKLATYGSGTCEAAFWTRSARSLRKGNHITIVTCQLWLIGKEKKGIFKGSQYELSHLVIHNIFLKYFHALPPKISWIPSKFESQAYLSFGREFPIVSHKIEKRLPILNLASKTSQRDANFQSLLSACQLFQRI